MIFLFIVLLSSCTDKPIYSESKSFSDAWHFADSVHFDLPAPDTIEAYAMVLNVSHTTDYPFQNIYFRISTAFPSGRRVSTLLNIDLADKSGAWYGDCRGKNCNLQAPIRENFYFSESGAYKITMEQFTRVDPLTGLTRLKLELYRASE